MEILFRIRLYNRYPGIFRDRIHAVFRGGGRKLHGVIPEPARYQHYNHQDQSNQRDAEQQHITAQLIV